MINTNKTLEQLKKEEREASDAFMYAKIGEDIKKLYKEQEIARRALQDYKMYNSLL